MLKALDLAEVGDTPEIFGLGYARHVEACVDPHNGESRGAWGQRMGAVHADILPVPTAGWPDSILGTAQPVADSGVR